MCVSMCVVCIKRMTACKCTTLTPCYYEIYRNKQIIQERRVGRLLTIRYRIHKHSNVKQRRRGKKSHFERCLYGFTNAKQFIYFFVKCVRLIRVFESVYSACVSKLYMFSRISLKQHPKFEATKNCEIFYLLSTSMASGLPLRCKNKL